MTEPYKQLERKWAEIHKVTPDQCVAVSSGSAALHLAFESLLVDNMATLPSKSVVVPDFTMIACPRAVVLAGLYPRFADCNHKLLMNQHTMEAAAWCNDVAAVMPVHIYGRRCEVNAPENAFVVEDCAEAHGMPLSGKADAYCWSFYKNKIVAGEEGGAIIFKDKFHADQARILKNMGFYSQHNFMHMPRGMNYRLSNAHAELILRSMQVMGRQIESRRESESWFNELVPKNWQMPVRDTPWVYDIRIPDMQGIDELVSKLNDDGVPARCSFKPMSIQTEFFGLSKNENALAASQQVLYLPFCISKKTAERWVSKLIQGVDNGSS